MERLKIYLAGPEVFLPDAVALGAAKKALCAEFGFEGLFPFDNEVEPRPGTEIDRIIYDANVSMMRRADVGIFNLTPFRGPSADVGTVFELGLMTALDKICLGYANTASDLLTRVRASMPTTRDVAAQVWRDPSGMTVEDFGNCDNLMIDSALETSVARIARCETATDPFRDLAGFRECLLVLRERSDSSRFAA